MTARTIGDDWLKSLPFMAEDLAELTGRIKSELIEPTYDDDTRLFAGWTIKDQSLLRRSPTWLYAARDAVMLVNNDKPQVPFDFSLINNFIETYESGSGFGSALVKLEKGLKVLTAFVHVTSKPKPPKKRTRKNMTWEMADDILLHLLKEDPVKYAGMGEREMAKAVGCSRKTLTKTTSYENIEKVREELRNR
ncbi:MAG: hypothetical protein ABGZ53_00130 [Fuerstiella sp.]